MSNVTEEKRMAINAVLLAVVMFLSGLIAESMLGLIPSKSSCNCTACKCDTSKTDSTRKPDRERITPSPTP